MTAVMPPRRELDLRPGPHLFDLAVALITDGATDEEAARAVLEAAEWNTRPLEAAYGRAVAVLSETTPPDPVVRRAVDAVSKALSRGHRLASAGGRP